MFQNSLQELKSWQFVYLKEATSTNSYIKDNCANTNPRQKVAVFTDHQTDGRGQYGSTWSSANAKNLLCSLFIPFNHSKISSSFPFQWNMYIALVIRQVVETFINTPTSIKWPNDIIVEGRKIAGILIQNMYSGSQLSGSIVGVGINVNQEIFDQNLPNATSLKLIGKQEYVRQNILFEIIGTLDRKVIDGSKLKDDELILNLYNKYLYKRAELVTCIDQEGNKMEGKLSHIDKQGDLNLISGSTHLKLQHGNYKLEAY